FCLVATSSAMFSLYSSCACRMVRRSPRKVSRTRGAVQACGTGRIGRLWQGYQSAVGQHGTRLRDVPFDLLYEKIHRVVRAHVPESRDEVQRHRLAVQVLVEVQDMGLDTAFLAGEGRVGADT